MVASPKPMVPLFAFTASLHRARLLNLIRGTVPFIFRRRKASTAAYGATDHYVEKNMAVDKRG